MRLVPGVSHTQTVHWPLPDAIDGIRLWNAGRFQDGWNDVDEMMKLPAYTTGVRNMSGPGHGHTLCCATEMRCHLLHPFERRGKSPCPFCRKMRERFVRTPERVPEQLGFHRYRNAIECSELVWRSVEHPFGAWAVVSTDVNN